MRAPAAASSRDSFMNPKTAFFYLVLILLPFSMMEGVFRLLPVSSPPYILPVTAQHPVARFQPGIDYVFSKGWDFSIRTRKRSNNFGYNNVSDYRQDDTTPLLMVIGDSFVEAHSVDAGKSAAELLHSAVRERGRVYSIGLSGAPLSQYLVFAEYARTTFRPSAMAFVIIENDFDESLLKYNSHPGFHYFAENGSQLALQRVDYELSTPKSILRQSAFVRYVVHNLVAEHTVAKLRGMLSPFGEAKAGPEQSAAELEQRIQDSNRAVDHFLDQVSLVSGVDRESIIFVVDARRPAIYSPEALPESDADYGARVRRYFMTQARLRGHEVLDLDPPFRRRHRLDNSRFEFPTDGHWNELGNELVAAEMRESAVFTRLFGQQTRASR
jgi:hypothetical protein